MNHPLIKLLKTLRRSNWLMTLLILALLAFGLMFVYSACYVGDDQNVRQLYKRQIVWMIAGLASYITLSLYDFHRFKRISWAIYGSGLVLLILVLFIGSTIYGAKRWLMLFGVIGLQPSEIAKLSTIILLAHQLSRPGLDLSRMRDIGSIMLMIGVPVGLIMMQPDLGTAMVFVPTAFIMMFVAGLPIKYLGILAATGITLVAFILSALFLPAKLGAGKETQDRIRNLTFLSDYQQGRIEVFFQPDKDPLGAGWNKRQSEIAVGSGGLKGKGYLKGTQNILGFLPRSVAPTDFIYSVIAEEKGFLGSLTVLALFFGVLTFGMLTALRTRDAMGRLLCVGVVSLIFCHVFINIAMTVGLMPITGLPLPLLSYGGSFMIMMMSALGIIQSVYIRSHRRDSYE
jgi:rod shape determining protein RodA